MDPYSKGHRDSLRASEDESMTDSELSDFTQSERV